MNSAKSVTNQKTPAGGSYGFRKYRRETILQKIWPYRSFDQTPISKEEVSRQRVETSQETASAYLSKSGS